MTTQTEYTQATAARLLLVLLTSHPDLPEPDAALRRLYSPVGEVWGVKLSLHDDLTQFERWRQALRIAPARVTQDTSAGTGWLEAATVYAGVPLELIGFYDVARPGHGNAVSSPRFWDPDGSRFGGIPTFPWRMAPDGYLTRRQLRARGLRPGGQSVAAQILWTSRRCKGVRAAYLYRLDLRQAGPADDPGPGRRAGRPTAPAAPARSATATPDTCSPPDTAPASPAPTHPPAAAESAGAAQLPDGRPGPFAPTCSVRKEPPVNQPHSSTHTAPGGVVVDLNKARAARTTTPDTGRRRPGG